jgi:methylated-DNA-protein-cysteine methyltransferase related protein
VNKAKKVLEPRKPSRLRPVLVLKLTHYPMRGVRSAIGNVHHVTPSRTSRARSQAIIKRVQAIPEGFVNTYGDIDRAAPRLVGYVLATTTEAAPWQRVVRADGSVPMGATQLRLLRRERVPLRGDRVDLRSARWPGMDHLSRERGGS